MKYILILCLLSFTTFLHGSESQKDVRPSSFMSTLSKGSDNYQSFLLDTTFGLNPEWSISGSYFQSDSGVATLLNEELISKEEQISTSWKIDKTWTLGLGIIARQDPYEINSNGGFLSVNTNINNWWKGSKNTSLTLKAEILKVTQDLQVQRRFVNLNIYKTLKQKNAYISLNQELLDFLSVSLSHNRYTYSNESSNLGFTTATRRISTGGGGALSYGYPESRNSLDFYITPLDWLELRLGGSIIKTLGSDSKTQTMTIGTSFYWENFQIDTVFSKSDYGTSSNNQSSEENYTSIGLGYNW